MDKAIENKILEEIKKERTRKNLHKLFTENNVSREDQIEFRKKHRPLIHEDAKKERMKSFMKEWKTEFLEGQIESAEERIKVDSLRLELMKQEIATRG